MKVLLWIVAVVLPLLAVCPATAGLPIPVDLSEVLARFDDQDPLPGGWYGIWQIQIQIKDCVTQQVQFSTSDTDTICPDEEVLSDPEINYQCTGTVSDTEFHMTCTAQYEEVPGCLADVSVAFDGTRTGNSFFTVGIFNYTYTGAACEPEGTFCSRFEQTGTRTSTDTSGCETPVRAGTWGGIKARYP